MLSCAVGDTIVENTPLLQVHGAKGALPEKDLRRAIHLGPERTSEQDPKYPIRLLVDIAIRAHAPATEVVRQAQSTLMAVAEMVKLAITTNGKE